MVYSRLSNTRARASENKQTKAALNCLGQRKVVAVRERGDQIVSNHIFILTAQTFIKRAAGPRGFAFQPERKGVFWNHVYR